ncbi:MAG: GldG family protein, partial [Elusimicrobia bacterium]|nr:GldG family protein [Elusimicrobiota bacterium]
KKYTEDLLEEYRSYKRAKFKIEIKDPAKEKELADEAMQAGVYPIQFTSIEADKYEVKEGYMGLVFYYKDRKEVIPFIKETEGLEYLISSTIKKLINPENKKIGVLDEFDCTTLDDNDTIKGQFEGRFTMEKVKLDKDLGDFSALLVISPKKKIDEENMTKLKTLIKQVPTAFFIDKLDVPLTSFYAKKVEADLSEILSEYGLKLKNGTVLDLQNQRIGVQQRRGWFTISNIVEYPPFVVATKFAKTPPTLGMERVVLPFVNAFEVKKSTQYKTTELIFSSPKSWLDTITVFNPLQRFIIPPAPPRGPFTLGVSVVSDKERLIFVGTSRFIEPQTVQDPANLTFFMNIIDWLIQDQDLISIRTKGVVFRPLKKVSAGTKLFFKYVNLFGNSFVLLLIGIILWRKNASRRKVLQKIYEA